MKKLQEIEMKRQQAAILKEQVNCLFLPLAIGVFAVKSYCFWVTIILSVLVKKSSLYQLKNKIIYNSMIFVATKNCWCWCCLIRDPVWIKIKIRDKHPGSATLLAIM
jgi:hypothetical protein